VDSKHKVITHLPLAELWRDDGFSTTKRERSLTAEDVLECLASGPVQFVVADVGWAPRWVPARECFQFWTNEVKPHLANGTEERPDDFPSGYCYFASRWESEGPEAPIVLLEKQH